MNYVYLKFPDEATCLAKLALISDPVEVDTLGVISHDEGPVAGWHVNLVVHGEVPAALYPYCVNPARPKRIFFGCSTLAMPETLVDAGETVLVARGIGHAVDERALIALETDVVLAKMAAEPERRALHEATLAVLEHRDALAAMPIKVDVGNRLDGLRAARDALKVDVEVVKEVVAEPMVDVVAERGG